MSPDDPEGHTSTHTLSPVSPKPVHYPAPSNIPILENQMDPSFNLAAAQSEPQQTHGQEGQMQNGFHRADSSAAATNGQQDQQKMSDNGHAAQAEGTAGPDDSRAMSVDAASGDAPNGQVASTVPFHDPSAGPPAATFQSLNPLDHHIQPELVPYHSPEGSQQSEQTAQQQEQVAAAQGGVTTGAAVDLQKLLDNIAASTPTAPSSGSFSHAQTDVPMHDALESQLNGADQTASTAAQPATQLLPGPAGANLPPRPPPQQHQTSTAPGNDIRAFHPHEQGSSAPVYSAPPGATFRPPGNVPPPTLTAGAPGTTPSGSSLPPPPLASFQQAGQGASQQEQQALYLEQNAAELKEGDEKIRNEGEDLPWGQEVQRQYDAFLKDERMYVTEGQWDKFPANSRLFIGNLPTEKVTKRDLFHVFHKHGKLAQVSIKQAYGFIQYLDASACFRALQVEQGANIRGRKIHLEISKPQKNTKGSGGKNENRERRNRRSRSPEHGRGGDGGGNQKGDRYRGSGNNRQRQRDDYRPGRSPSPRARGGRDEHRRSPDRRRRSKSRSPRGRGGRRRSPSPGAGLEDDCPLPRRDPRNVPDVQLIAKDEPDRAFITYVEKTFEARGVRTNVVVLNPRLSEPSVVRRQIIEGVLAVMKLDRMVQVTQKFPLSIFDRSGGANNVRFEEYTNQDLNICVELVLRAKQTARATSSPTYITNAYGLPILQNPGQQPQPFTQFGQQQQLQQATPTSATFSPSMDTSALQQILSRVTNQHPQGVAQAPGGAYQPTTDLSKILAGAAAASSPPPQHAPQQQPPYAQPSQQYGNIASNPAFAGLFGGAAAGRPQSVPQQQQPGLPPQHHQQHQPQSPSAQAPPGAGAAGQPDMRSIMAQLARYGR